MTRHCLVPVFSIFPRHSRDEIRSLRYIKHNKIQICYIFIREEAEFVIVSDISSDDSEI